MIFMKYILLLLTLYSCDPAQTDLNQFRVESEKWAVTKDFIIWGYYTSGVYFADTFQYTDHGQIELYEGGAGQVTWPSDVDDLSWTDSTGLEITFWKSYENDIAMTDFGKITIPFFTKKGVTRGTANDTIVMGDNLTITYHREMTIKKIL